MTDSSKGGAMPGNLYDRMREWGCNVAPVRFNGRVTLEDYMQNKTHGELVTESIVLVKLAALVIDGLTTTTTADTFAVKETNRLLGDVVKRLSEAGDRIADIDQAQADAAVQMADAMANRDRPRGKVVIKDGPNGVGYAVYDPNGQIGIAEGGFDVTGVVEAARSIAKKLDWPLIDDTAAGVLNPWVDVGGKEGDA